MFYYLFGYATCVFLIASILVYILRLCFVFSICFFTSFISIFRSFCFFSCQFFSIFSLLCVHHFSSSAFLFVCLRVSIFVCFGVCMNFLLLCAFILVCFLCACFFVCVCVCWWRRIWFLIEKMSFRKKKLVSQRMTHRTAINKYFDDPNVLTCCCESWKISEDRDGVDKKSCVWHNTKETVHLHLNSLDG